MFLFMSWVFFSPSRGSLGLLGEMERHEVTRLLGTLDAQARPNSTGDFAVSGGGAWAAKAFFIWEPISCCSYNMYVVMYTCMYHVEKCRPSARSLLCVICKSVATKACPPAYM